MNKLRKNVDTSEYKQIVLGLIFLRYISETPGGLYEKLKKGKGEYSGSDPKDKDEYKAENVFFVPDFSFWIFLRNHAKQPDTVKALGEIKDIMER